MVGILSILLIFIPSVNALADIDPPPAKEILTGKTSKEIVAEMGLGWNLGNTFDATGGNKTDITSQETSWGNPVVTKELITLVHDRGFNTIRIPVTWGAHHIDKNNNYTITPAFLARVKEVVDYAYELNMYIILNVHHEPWVNVSDLDKSYETVGEELEAVWSQISDYFADYDQHLIFEGMNEPRMANTPEEWNGNQDAYLAVNYLNQVFTFTVRNSKKGFNSERCLMIPGYAASSSANILESISLPTFEGKTVNNLIISSHCYSPYDFCLSDEQYDFDPDNKQHTSAIDSLFVTLEKTFLFNDIPVVIGETSATDKNNTEEREKWAEYMGRKSREYGIPIVIWDNGSNTHSGGESHAWVLRRENKWNNPSVIDKLFSSSETVEWGSVYKKDRAEYETDKTDTGIIGGKIIWENHDGYTVAGIAMSHAQPISIPMIRSYVSAGIELAVAYSGSSSPLLFFYKDDTGVLTSGIAPYKTEERKGKQVAFYKFAAINEGLSEAGIESAAELNSIMIASEGPDISIFETDALSVNSNIVFFAGGQSFTSQKSVKTLKGLKLLGWYTTKDYREGTEFDGNAFRDTTLYGKLAWEKDSAAMAMEHIDTDKDSISPSPTPTAAPEPTDISTPTPLPDPTKEPVISKPAAETDKADKISSDDKG